jgi:hypothetical protein
VALVPDEVALVAVRGGTCVLKTGAEKPVDGTPRPGVPSKDTGKEVIDAMHASRTREVAAR